LLKSPLPSIKPMAGAFLMVGVFVMWTDDAMSEGGEEAGFPMSKVMCWCVVGKDGKVKRGAGCYRGDGATAEKRIMAKPMSFYRFQQM
jgi:hypothetical protein